jgi:hypothetical protein
MKLRKGERCKEGRLGFEKAPRDRQRGTPEDKILEMRDDGRWMRENKELNRREGDRGVNRRDER